MSERRNFEIKLASPYAGGLFGDNKVHMDQIVQPDVATAPVSSFAPERLVNIGQFVGADALTGVDRILLNTRGPLLPVDRTAPTNVGPMIRLAS